VGRDTTRQNALILNHVSDSKVVRDVLQAQESGGENCGSKTTEST